MPKLKPDTVWRRFNLRLEKLMKVGDFFRLATTYYEMAYFLEKEDRDPTDMRKLGYEMKLKSGHFSVPRHDGIVDRVEILATDDSCEACKKINHQIFSTEEAQLQKPIPSSQCKHKYGCRCTYLPIVNRRI